MPTVLITGASRGIGRATALWLAARGWDVLAGVRSADHGAALAAVAPGRITPVTLDITDEAQIAALAAELPQRLNAVVNNAGVVVGGAVETIPGARAAPPARDQRRRPGRRHPGGAAPAACRAGTDCVRLLGLRPRAHPDVRALQRLQVRAGGMPDALRMELRPWGIRVALVEPAQTDTDLWRLAEDELDTTSAQLSEEHRRLYARQIEGFRRTIPRSMKVAAPADGVAAAIARALSDRRPKTRYVVGRPAQLQALLARLTPTPVLDRMLALGTGVPRRVS